MRKKKKTKRDDLDTETTFVDMNVEGFNWYDPHRKNFDRKNRVKIPRKEYWLMVRAAFAAMWPAFVIVTLAFGAMVLIGYLWLM